MLRASGCLVALALIFGAETSANAVDGGAVTDAGPVTRIDTVEHIFGASNINAMVGHGGLTAGISKEGDVTVLSWPGPSCCDQLTYMTSNSLNARSLPHYGAAEGMGISTGVAIDGVADAGPTTYWLHDGTWAIDQQYLDDTSLLPVTHFRNNALDLDVTITDAIDPTVDVLQRWVSVTRGPSAPSGNYAVITLSNLSPTVSELEELPIADWALDIQNDFGAVWDESANAVVHFRPADRAPLRTFDDLLTPPAIDYGAFDQLLNHAGNDAGEAMAFANALDTNFNGGVYAAITTVPTPTEHEVGYDSTDFCGTAGSLADNITALPSLGISLPLPPGAADLIRCTDPIPNLRSTRGWLHDAPDARLDAATGHLSGSNFAAGQVDVALRTPLDANNQVAIRLVFGSTAEAALASLAGLPSPSELQTNDLNAWHSYSATLTVPTNVSSTSVNGATADAVTRTVRRALLHDASGTSRATGAIVASIARQAPYGLDWPRDGSFFDYAFDIAGDTDRVTRRLEWETTTIRQNTLSHVNTEVDSPPPADPITGHDDYPANAWEMNSYADGVNGGNIRFEIDNTALMVWSMGAHVGYLDEPQRSQVAAALYPTVQAAANTIAGWRDPTTGLNAPASEDDNYAFTSSLHGATAVYAGLQSASRLARFLGHNDDAQRWDTRSSELQNAIVTQLYDPDAGLFQTLSPTDGVINVGAIGNGDTAWLVWPAEVLPFNDDRVNRQLRSDLNAALAVLRGQGEGGQYLGKIFLAGAVAVTHGADPSLQPLVEEGIARLSVLIPTANTQAYGEVYVNVGTSSEPVFDQRTSNPHLWEGTLTYLAAMALEHPELFDRDHQTLQPKTAIPTPVPKKKGCGCTQQPDILGASWIWLAALLTCRRRRGS